MTAEDEARATVEVFAVEGGEDRSAAAAGVLAGFEGFHDSAAWHVRVIWDEQRESYVIQFARDGKRQPEGLPPVLTWEDVVNTGGVLKTAMAQFVGAYLERWRRQRRLAERREREEHGGQP